MFLKSLAVENYRALRRANIHFDDTTVLIGENDCGKSSLLEALAIGLDPTSAADSPRFQPYHFHRESPDAMAAMGGPLRIELRFSERRPGEWDALGTTPLAPLLGLSGGRREMVLEVRATPAAGAAEVVGEWRLSGGGATIGDEPGSSPALAFLRQLNPLVWMHPGGLLGSTPEALRAQRRSRALSPRALALVDRIEQSQSAITSGTAADLRATVDQGFDAAREFIAFAARHLGGRRHGLREMVAEIFGTRQPHLPARTASPMPGLARSSAERIGVLALVAALLRIAPDSLPVGAEPIWVIEDPETQLHPMTVASVLRLIGDIRWQKIVTTQSGDVLAAEPLGSLRRLTRRGAIQREWYVRPRRLSAEDLRRVSYHLRARRGVATFARCWLLVEGETEFWVLPELAAILGHDFAVEGIACVEFAQCGLRPLVKLAGELGIEWHVLADGDAAGQRYAEQAREFAGRVPMQTRVTMLADRDIESCFFSAGYAPVFRRLAGAGGGELPPKHVIERAIDRHSKPMLALELVLAASAGESPGVPEPLAQAIRACAALACEGEPVSRR